MTDSGISREEIDAKFETLRTEISSGLSTAGVQIGAVEKTLIEKMHGLRLWGVTALVGGQVVTGLVVKLTGGSLSAPATSAARTISRLFS